MTIRILSPFLYYRIAWRSKFTGATGHGKYLTPTLAKAWLERAEAEWGDLIDHWLEPK